MSETDADAAERALEAWRQSGAPLVLVGTAAQETYIASLEIDAQRTRQVAAELLAHLGAGPPIEGEATWVALARALPADRQVLVPPVGGWSR